MTNKQINKQTFKNCNDDGILCNSVEYRDCIFLNYSSKKAIYSYVVFTNCVFNVATFESTEFFNCDFWECSFVNTSFSFSELHNCTITEGIFNLSTFQTAKLNSCILYNNAFNKGFIFSEVTFREGEIEKCTFQNSSLKNTLYDNVTIKDCTFTRSNCFSSCFNACKINNTHINNCELLCATFPNTVYCGGGIEEPNTDKLTEFPQFVDSQIDTIMYLLKK